MHQVRRVWGCHLGTQSLCLPGRGLLGLLLSSQHPKGRAPLTLTWSAWRATLRAQINPGSCPNGRGSVPRALWHVGMEAQPLYYAQGLCTALQLVLLAVPLPANSLVPQQVLGFSLRPMRRSIASPHLSPRTLDSSFFTP